MRGEVHAPEAGGRRGRAGAPRLLARRGRRCPGACGSCRAWTRGPSAGTAWDRGLGVAKDRVAVLPLLQFVADRLHPERISRSRSWQSRPTWAIRYLPIHAPCRRADGHQLRPAPWARVIRAGRWPGARRACRLHRVGANHIEEHDMRDQPIAPAPARRVWRRPMLSRGSSEEHRASTPLELFFDLCFVVAVAQAAAQLHHALASGQVAHGLVGYAAVFFAIWWAWMNFTWFASAYDTDDVLYRVATLVQIAGVLVLAAGVPRAFDDDFVIVSIGYLLMRVALSAQWLRAARDDRPRRSCALRSAAGISACQVGWVARLALPDPWGTVGFAVLGGAGAGRADLGGAGGLAALAPGPHRRALRAVHAHRARRVRGRRHHRGPVRARQRPGPRRVADAGRRRAADHLLDVVAVLRAARRGAAVHHQSDIVRVGLRPLPDLRLGGRRRRRAAGRRRP